MDEIALKYGSFVYAKQLNQGKTGYEESMDGIRWKIFLSPDVYFGQDAR